MDTRIIAVALLAALAATMEAATTKYHGYTFEAYAVSASGRRLAEHKHPGRPTLLVHEGDEYSIVLRNPLPVRAGVALSIDGLNSVDGERSSPAKGSKWVLEPNSTITIRGWQTGMSKSRRFVFTNKSESYAEWKEEQDNARYTQNLGVVGVAWFWSSAELADALNPPRPFVQEDESWGYRDKRGEAYPSAGMGAASESAAKSRSADQAPERKSEQERAGTGMGRQERHSVTRVEFEYDTGMYSGDDVLAIYYEFARPKSQPRPFVEEEDEGGFAPDMHSDNRPTPWWLWR